jgi:phosphoserine phosphatase
MDKYRGHQVILLNIAGEDKPGVTASLTGILAGYDIQVLDIGQAVIHEDLGLGILFRVPESSETGPILKDILFRAYELGLNVKFTPVPLQKYEEWVTQQGKDRYIITLLGRKLEARHISELTKIITAQNLNIDYITRLTGRPSISNPNPSERAVVEFSVRGTPPSESEMKKQFIELAGTIGVDVAFQNDNIYRRNRRLVCFDMDSTLIQTEVIDELAHEAGIGDKVAAITEAAMRGELDFEQSFKERVALLKGLDEKVMKKIAENLPLTDGAERLFKILKKYGYKTAILSGGFNYFGHYLKHKLGVDYVFANDLEIKDGKLTGNHMGDIVDGNRKAELLKLIAFKEDIHLNQVIAVGDGSNDLPMLNMAGLGIAFHAKPKVKESARHAISNNGLDAILYLLGFRDREINE